MAEAICRLLTLADISWVSGVTLILNSTPICKLKECRYLNHKYNNYYTFFNPFTFVQVTGPISKFHLINIHSINNSGQILSIMCKGSKYLNDTQKLDFFTFSFMINIRMYYVCYISCIKKFLKTILLRSKKS